MKTCLVRSLTFIKKLDRQLKKQAHKPNARRASHSEKPTQAEAEDAAEYDDEVEFDEV